MSYDAFISYSHAADGELAPALQQGLQRLAKPWNARRALRVFRDETGLSTNPHLWSAIEAALDESEWFVLLASPEAARSEWVNREISHWRATKSAARILPVVTDGTWEWDPSVGNFTPGSSAVPDALRGALADEPRHLDLRWARSETDLNLRNSQFRSAVADLAAPIHGVAKDELEGEDIRQHQRARRLARAGVSALALLVVLSVVLGLLALASRDHAVSVGTKARAQALAAKSQNELSADPEVSVILARRAVQVSPIPEAVAALRQAVDASPVRVALPTRSGKTCGFNSGPAVALSPSGDRIAESLCTGDVIVHDAATGRVVKRRQVAREASAVAYDPRGDVLAVGTDRGIELLDPSNLRTQSRLDGHGEPNAIAFSPDGAKLAATTDLGVTVWDVASGTPGVSLSAPEHDGTVAFTTDGQSLVVGTDGPTEVVDLGTGQIVQRLSSPDRDLDGNVNTIAVAGDHLVVGTNVNPTANVSAYVDVWNTSTWTREDVLSPVSGTAITSVDISADGQKVSIGNADGSGGVWSRQSKERLVTLAGQTAALGAVKLSRDATTVATASNDGTARIYRATPPARVTVSGAVCSCGNEIGWQGTTMRALVRANGDVMLESWQLPSGRAQPNPPVLGTNESALGVVLSRHGTLMARWNEATPTTKVEAVDTGTGKVVFTLPATTVQGVSFSNDDRHLVIVDREGGLHVTTLANGRTVVGHGWTVGCNPGAGYPPAISPDGRRVAVWSFCGRLTVGRLDTAKPESRYSQRGQLSGLAFDPSGTRLALSSWAGAATVLDVATMRPVLELVGHTGGVNGVAYSPSGRYLATTSTDATLRIWNATTGQVLQIAHDPNGPGKPSFSPDGRFIVEANDAAQIRVWDACKSCADPGALLAESRASVVSPLTPLERARIASLDR